MYQKSKTVAGWTLQRFLGRGGNGEVWRGRHSQHGTAAVKFLTNLEPDRLQRFRSEVEVLSRLGNMPGILPIIAYDLPRSPTRRSPPWLAMREATRLRENLGDNPSLREVVVSISAVAGTLADLAERGVFHRDLKPDNLFHLDGRAVVGDFGLATFPGKPAQTVAGPKLGPLFYIAQEMLESPEEAKPGPADVFSAQSQKYSGF